MGIALLNLTGLFIPLQTLARRWFAGHSQRGSNPSGLRYVGVRPSHALRGKQTSTCRPHGPTPVRVVRTVEASYQGKFSGRLVISGRMADVCDELDRLAALEAASTGKLTVGSHRA